MPDEVAIAGPDGRRAAELLGSAKGHGAALLARLCAAAVRRLLLRPEPLAEPVLFTDAELKELQQSLAATIATADLLGRARVRGRLEKAADRHGVELFSPDHDDAFSAFDEPVEAHPPARAVDYFRRLVPSLSGDPRRYGPLLDRHAFTLAVATDQVVLDKVKQAIAARLEAGAGGPADVGAVLDAAGVSPENPQYGEMVFRTNMLDAYNQGSAAEMSDPAVAGFFPVWRYDGILDSRTGDDHRPKIGRYYPNEAVFAEVRGPRVYNCRCSPTPVSKWDWADLQKQGRRAEEDW